MTKGDAMSEREVLEVLRDAAISVVESWEGGDLAAAVRNLAGTLDWVALEIES